MICSILAWSVSVSFCWADAGPVLPARANNTARAAAMNRRPIMRLILVGAMASPIIADPATAHNRHRPPFTGMSAAALPSALLLVAARAVENVLGTQPGGRSFGQ